MKIAWVRFTLVSDWKSVRASCSVGNVSFCSEPFRFARVNDVPN